MEWARSQGYVVFTHDLDFGNALAMTRATGPSVLQVRAENVLPEHLGPIVLNTLKTYEPELAAGALIVVEETRARVRILPI
jgi:predicted nuclease of predicted toxin-antitoxin system